jgi:Alternative complex III, ActD subunit
MTAVYALFVEPEEVQRAVDNLHAAGVPDAKITVVSSEPIEEYPFSHRDSATWLYRIAGGGGLLGLIFATWLTSWTEQAWPLPTGNMPIVSWWPNLIVMFELTMLGAILATVITLFITAKLGGRGPQLYDPEVTTGKILVGVENPSPDRRDAITRALREAGNGPIRSIAGTGQAPVETLA